ncbi:hypothetical protein PENTCL1PPCAC_16873, partial [Pristionchus entomophagus]
TSTPISVVRSSFSTRLAALWIQFPIVPVSLIVIIVSVRINAILASLDHMSTNSKRRHEQILRRLLCQSLLPALYGIGVIVYALQKRKNSHELGHLTMIIISLLTALSPLFTLFFTLLYREAL